jgi:3-phenylpropionate/trans-cinnamate dioxygenase ferredoxin reductase component
MQAKQGDRIVIVGAGHAGGRTAQHLRALGFAGDIALIGEETSAPYERPALSKEVLLGAKAPSELFLQKEQWWRESGIELTLASRVSRIDRANRSVDLADGRRLAFDHLVLAMGGAARRLAIPGADDPRVVTLRTMADGLALAEHLTALRRLVIIGGGVIGLEVAAAARQRGVAVTLLEAGDRLMARVVPPAVSDWLLNLHRTQGVSVHLGARTDAIETFESSLIVRGNDSEGRPLAVKADLVLVAVGIDPSVDCLKGSGIGVLDGVLVDEFCRVDGAPIYAVGDVASTRTSLNGEHIRLETWRNAENQSRAVAEFLCGRATPYIEIPWMWSDQHGRNIQVVGRWAPDMTLVVRGSLGEAGSTCLFLSNSVVKGGALIDQGRDRRFVETMVSDGQTRNPHELADRTIPLRKLA